MAGVTKSLNGPWAVGGDWNCTPEELAQTNWLKIVKGTVVAPQVSTCNSRVIDFFVVSEGMSQAAPAAYTIGDGGFYPRSAVRLILRGRARATVVRKLKAPRGFAAVLPQGPHNQEMAKEDEQGKRLGSDYAGLISRIEEELCAIEGRDGKEAEASCGIKKGVAYCWKNAMGETTAENSRTTSVSRAWRVSARWLKDILKSKKKRRHRLRHGSSCSMSTRGLTWPLVPRHS